jgi:hypothetical protein
VRHISHGPASVTCHRCEQPLRVDAPPTGWVTVLAGLLACGSSPLVRPSQFPSGRCGRKARRSQLRGQPRLRRDDVEMTKPSRPVFPLASPVQPGEPARGQHSAVVRRGQEFCSAKGVGWARKTAGCCSVATEYDGRPWHSVPACGPWGHRTPAAVTHAGYAYCQLRDTQLTVQSRCGHGPRGKGARALHGHPCLGGFALTGRHLHYRFDCSRARSAPGGRISFGSPVECFR